uniref:YopX family protein n=1 Tax=Helicobacter bilis TaxID=37372 RepID=UPI002D78AA6B
RLWHKPSERFVEIKSAFITTNGKDEIVFDRAYNVPIDDESVEIELWSGFLDKNGKKIYEGDILAHDNGYGIEYHSKVVFENGVFKIAIIEHPAVEIIED